MRSFRISLAHTKRDMLLIALLTVFLLAYYSYMRSNFLLVSSSGGIDKVVELAVKERNPILCRKIRQLFIGFGPTDEANQSTCFYRLAKRLNDRTLCFYTNLKELCQLELQ